MMKNKFYTTLQVHQVVDEVLRRLEVTPAPQVEPMHLDNSIPQHSSPGTKMTVSVQEAAAMIGISKPTMYALIREGDIPCVHVGKKIVIARQAILDWLSEGENYGKKAC